MPRPYTNPEYPNSKRDKHINKRVIEETAEMERVCRETGAKTNEQIIRDYLNRKTKKDHVTYLLLSQVVFGYKYGIPKNDTDRLKFEHARDRLSNIIGQITDNTDATSIGRELHEDTQTKDVEYVYFNAKKEVELKEVREKTEANIETRKKRLTKKIDIANTSWPMRKRLARREENANRGIF